MSMKREKIEQTLQSLIGLPLCKSHRGADMQGFHFGAQHSTTTRRGEPAVVGDYALHVQCAWCIVGPEGIIVGSRDVYYPPGDDPYDQPPDFHWDTKGGN